MVFMTDNKNFSEMSSFVVEIRCQTMKKNNSKTLECFLLIFLMFIKIKNNMAVLQKYHVKYFSSKYKYKIKLVKTYFRKTAVFFSATCTSLYNCSIRVLYF